VPNFVGVNLSEYPERELHQPTRNRQSAFDRQVRRLLVTIKYAFSASAKSGTIISQSPAYNTEAKTVS